MTIDFSEGIDPQQFAPLPAHDRAFVGGRTVWTGPYRPPVVVCQPNRWGVVEDTFPSVPCVVEADPVVTGWLALPDDVVGFVDRAHRPISQPGRSPEGREAMRKASRLASMVAQLKGVGPLTRDFARTVPLITPVEAVQIIEFFDSCGIVGVRPLDGLAGGLAVTVRADHTEAELRSFAEALEQALGR